MSRTIIYDEDTLVGYSYPTKKFYITNKGTTTYRNTSIQAKEVLDIVAPNNTISQEQIQGLQEPLEPITSLSFTYSDTGSYIATIQINDYAKNPLTIDLEKEKIYIMNTNIIYDLTLNEPKDYRIDNMISYYEKTHGLYISQQDMIILYDLLTSYYYPKVYNIIATPTNKEYKLTYSNKFACSNYNKKGVLVYNVEANPNNKLTTYHVTNINNNHNITLQETPTLAKYDKLQINNKFFTVNTISNNVVTVYEDTETYNYPYYKAYSLSPSLNISSIDNNTNTITCTTSIEEIEVGNTIVISGTSTINQTTTSTNDGIYTVKEIDTEENTITTNENLNIPYTHVEGADYPQLYKQVVLGNVLSIIDAVATLETALQEELPINSLVQIVDKENLIGTYPCTNISADKKELTLTNSVRYIPEFTEVACPSSNMLISTSYSKSDTFSTGEFMLDNFEQVQAYINTYYNLPLAYKPTEETLLNMYSNVPETKEISTVGGTINTMNLLGLYSEIYKDKK